MFRFFFLGFLLSPFLVLCLAIQVYLEAKSKKDPAFAKLPEDFRVRYSARLVHWVVGDC